MWAVASGPAGSVNDAARLPPDQACTPPWISHFSRTVRPGASRSTEQVYFMPGRPVAATVSQWP